jgi:predicted nucleotidyltransferase
VLPHEDILCRDFFRQLTEMPFEEAIFLFGSRARGDADAISDYDLAISCPVANAEQWRRLTEILENAPFLNHVDAVRYDALPEGSFKQQIDKVKQVLYARH